MTFITKCLIYDVIILFVSLFFLAYLYMTRKFKYWKKQGITEITPIPFVGNFGACLIAKKSAGQWLQDIYEFGSGLPYVGFYIFDEPALLVRDPELIKKVLVRDFNSFLDRYARASPHDRLGDANLFLLKNPAWKLVRSKLTPIYTSGRLKKLFELMVDVGNDLTIHMKNLNLEGNGKTLELKDLAAKFTTDLIATTAFGIKANCLNNPKAEFRELSSKIFEMSLYRNFELTGLFFAPNLVKPLGLKFLPKQGEKFLRKSIMDVISERERSDNKRNDLIDFLVELKKFNNDPSLKEIFDFDGDNLVAQAAVFFNGGFETSSSATSFTLYELALNPEIQTKLREEIVYALQENNGKITYDMVMNLSYMDMCVSEVLRKYPPLPFLDRQVTTDSYKVPNSNLVLEKGTPVVISITSLHYNPEYFPEPHKYDPERFTNANKKARMPFVYIPFGEGPHTCIGMRIGLLQVKLGLVKLLSEYEFSPCAETSIPLQISPKMVLTTAEHGIWLNVRKIVYPL